MRRMDVGREALLECGLKGSEALLFEKRERYLSDGDLVERGEERCVASVLLRARQDLHHSGIAHASRTAAPRSPSGHTRAAPRVQHPCGACGSFKIRPT